MYICDFSRSVGVGRAMCLNTRGLVRSVILRIVPPLPAESIPSKTRQSLAPEDLTHSCIATSSPCRRRISFSYCFLFSFGREASPAAAGDEESDRVDPRDFPDFPDFLAFLAFLPMGPVLPRTSPHHVH